jgi:glycine betaine/proline transport system substrate-binding protein
MTTSQIVSRRAWLGGTIAGVAAACVGGASPRMVLGAGPAVAGGTAAASVAHLAADPRDRAAGSRVSGRGGQAETVVLGQINLSFYQVVGAVVQEILEAVGHAVEIREGSHDEIYPVLGEGGLDVLAAAWLPNAHGTYWRRFEDRTVELATLYENARLYWAVPEYVPESEVRSVEDLLRPEVAARMTKTIRGIGSGSGLMMTEYGLAAAGYELVPGAARDWIANFEAAVAEGRWVVMPLWRPHFLNRAYPVRVLEEPRALLGGDDRAVLVANRERIARLPEATVDALRHVPLGLDVVTDLDYAVNVEGRTAREAARRWRWTTW